MRLQFVGCGDALGSGGREAHLPEIEPLILTHMSEDMLGRLDTLAHTPAHDGMIVELQG
ncbi:MAG: hypothetical protein KGQ48_13275 [Bradyrhizobium sp.]|nr:hypothetical protein [Bradyrhizobium sp.]